MTEISDQEKRQLLNQILQELDVGDRHTFDSLSSQELDYVYRTLREYASTGRSKLYKTLWEVDFEEKPVSIEKFLEDEDYLGKTGKMVYDVWKQELSDILQEDSKYVEVIFTGAIGIGKTTIANIMHAYKLYRLMCLRNPVSYYGLMGEGVTKLALGLFNVNLDLAYKANYDPFRAILMTSPWFKNRLQENRTGSWIEFPKDIAIALGSQGTHILGQAVIGGLLDEADFTKSKDYNQTIEVYNTIYRRMTSRFKDYLKVAPPGLLTLISSTVQDDASFINQRIKDAEKNPDTSKVLRYSHWDVHMYGKDRETFSVFIGDNLYPPKILNPKEDDLSNFETDTLIEVPEDYRKEFEDDVDRAILDLAGLRIGSLQNLFMRRTELLLNCIPEERPTMHPFTREEAYVTIDNDLKLQDIFNKDGFFRFYSDKFKGYAPVVNPTTERFIHFDLSRTGDATGIACVHCNGYRTRKVDLDDGRQKEYKVPVFYMDFAMKIMATQGSEIDFDKLEDFVVYLNAAGMRIGGISYDSFESASSMQFFKKSNLVKKERVTRISMDRTAEPYTLLRTLIVESRHSFYNYTPFIKEIKELRRDPDTKKVDHPKDGTKDVADAVCGATNHCYMYYDVSDKQPVAPQVSTIDREFGKEDQVPDFSEAANPLANSRKNKKNYPKI